MSLNMWVVHTIYDPAQVTTISGWVKYRQFCGSRKAESDNHRAGTRLRSGSVGFELTIMWRRITQRSAGKLPPVQFRRIRSLQKMIYRKMHNGICPLERLIKSIIKFSRNGLYSKLLDLFSWILRCRRSPSPGPDPPCCRGHQEPAAPGHRGHQRP